MMPARMTFDVDQRGKRITVRQNVTAAGQSLVRTLVIPIDSVTTSEEGGVRTTVSGRWARDTLVVETHSETGGAVLDQVERWVLHGGSDLVVDSRMASGGDEAARKLLLHRPDTR